MRRLQLLFVLFLLFISHTSHAQVSGMVGTDIFFSGRWLQIGQQNNGDFGTETSPAGYDAHPSSSAGATNLAEVYDYGHDGWAVGTPPFMGDYTFPGSPFEGWELQVNGTGGQNQMFCNGGAASVTGTGTLTGNNVSFVNVGGSLRGNWLGTAGPGGGLTIKQETRVDTNASWVVVTTKFYNTTGATIPNIYYMRTCDPDNNESWDGAAAFTTNNYIDYQNATDPDHRVQVRAVSSTPTPANQYPLALCTKDCRAVALIYDSWPLSAGVDLATLWNETYGTAFYTAGGHTPVVHNGDIAIGLVFNIGSICPRDSTFISYAYSFLVTDPGVNDNGISNVDSAFPEPNIVVNGVPANQPTAPNAIYDTFNACLYPGMTTLPINLAFANTGAWTWATWAWSPGTGLSSTTGTIDTINLLALPPSITYTITGTAYNGCGGTATGSCGTRVIYLTVLTCNGATVNSPCLGGALDFNAPGDSTGATYVWYGPNSWTPVPGGVTQSFTITPSTWADTGTYHVVKTVAGTNDTAVAIVILHPYPITTASSNSPLCIGALDTLELFSNGGGVPVATYAWTGPGGYTSSLQNPTIPGFSIADTGIYHILETTAYGCSDSATTHVVESPPPVAPTVTDPLTYCYGAAFVPFTVSGVTGTVYWYPTAAGGVGTTTAPVVNTLVPGTFTYYFGQTVGSCESPIDSITITVYPQVTASGSFVVHFGCVQDTVIFTNTSTGATSYIWNFGDGSPTVTTPDPTHYYQQPGSIWSVTLVSTANGCSTLPYSMHPDTRHSVTAAFAPLLDTICAGQSSTMNDASTATLQSGAGTIVSYLWNFADGTTDITANPSHTFAAAGIYNVTLMVTDAIGCTKDTSANVYVIGLTINSWLDTTLCLRQPLPLNNTIVQYPNLGLSNYTYSWTPGTDLDSTNVHIPYFNDGFGTFTYVETVSLLGDWGACTAQHTMIVNSVLGKLLTHVTTNTTILYGGSVQLNADSEVHYWWIPDNGSLNNPNINDPIATPGTTTTYTVYGMDQNGCVDSQFVTITVDSNMHECIPSGFTPNGDGLNDVFRPVGIKFQNMVEFRVYNRWGQQMFYSNNVEQGWDGTFQGVPQDMGTYFYTIIVARPGGQGDNIVYKGDVTLIR